MSPDFRVFLVVFAFSLSQKSGYSLQTSAFVSLGRATDMYVDFDFFPQITEVYSIGLTASIVLHFFISSPF